MSSYKDSQREDWYPKRLEVKVINNDFEEAFRRFKSMVQNDGILIQYKMRQTYEKPSEKKRRKRREAEERRFLAASREAQILSGEWERKQKKRDVKRQQKMEMRKKQDTSTGG